MSIHRFFINIIINIKKIIYIKTNIKGIASGVIISA